MITVIVHIANEDAIVCELDELPKPEDQIITVHNPRRRDGKDIHYLDEDVTTVIFPWHRINFIQVLPSADIEEVIGFVRE
ncbi:MAG: hypothetical protein D6706_08745 [Chloroflexi bacterium]|nr:MAG: hypothetical protein D6706_08745 [Chloroflexota bacterium]